MTNPSCRRWVSEAVRHMRDHLRERGHALSPFQEGIVSAMAGPDPRYEDSARSKLDEIKTAVDRSGRWSVQEEWRISTWFESGITRTQHSGGDWYEVSVTCDGQELKCSCPSIEGAYAYMCLYQKFIVEQFYSVGPPWAARSLFVDG
jgi:hypothetical protein